MRGKSPRIKACATDGTKEIMCDVLHFAKLASIILHGRKMMDSAPKKRRASGAFTVTFSVSLNRNGCCFVPAACFSATPSMPLRTLRFIS